MDDFVHGASQLFFLNGCSYLARFSDRLRVPARATNPNGLVGLFTGGDTVDFITIPFLFGYDCKALCANDFLQGLSFFGWVRASRQVLMTEKADLW
jgi:hypothetical protein